jgi:type VI secretion system secreted protein Hcp
MNTKISLLAIGSLVAVFAMLGTSSEAYAAIYVIIPSVPGDVQAEGYRGAIEIDSFSFGANHERKESKEKGGTEDINIGIGELQEIIITKKLDSSSAKIAQYAINGNSLGAAEIHFVETAGSEARSQPYLVYKLDRVFVKSWSTSASGDADDRPTEEVAFYYNKIAFGAKTTESPSSADQVMSWDVKKKTTWDSIIAEILRILNVPL